MTRLKICGLRDACNALVAARAGANYLGLVFVPGVRRRVTPHQAKDIVDRVRNDLSGDTPRLVGLFADQPVDELNRIVQQCGLDMAQLCGDEPPDYWCKVAVPIIKQIKVRDDDGSERAVEVAAGKVAAVIAAGQTAMLDRYEAGALGGTGRSFDWRVASTIAGQYDVVLAGGLTPENVAQAIAEVRPWGVDVSSGVESGGVKDPFKIERFAAQVGLADRRARESARG